MKKLLVILLVTIFFAHPAIAQDKKEAAFDRVMRTHTLRCGYIIIPPDMAKDPNSGAFSGVSYDVATEIGRRLHLKIDWTEEVNFGTMAAGLRAGRYDAVCFSLYRYSQQIPVLDFSIPLFYSSTGVYVRANDSRFDGKLGAINNPKVTIATVDGEMSQFIAADDYPQAKALSMPQSTDLTQMLLNVETGKADVTFVNGLVASGYLKAHPGKLKNIAANNPIRVFSQGFAFAKGQYDLVKMVDLTLAEMQDHGYMKKLLDKYDPSGKVYLRVVKPYEVQP